MIDGPGPPVTSRVAVRPVPFSVAWMISGLGSTGTTLATQRILLFTLASGGECSGSAHRIATIFPWSPITYGIGIVAGWNPARAQTGRVRGLTEARHGPAAAAAWLASAADAVLCAGGFTDQGCAALHILNVRLAATALQLRVQPTRSATADDGQSPGRSEQPAWSTACASLLLSRRTALAESARSEGDACQRGSTAAGRGGA
jgi:hypothetical protein